MPWRCLPRQRQGIYSVHVPSCSINKCNHYIFQINVLLSSTQDNSKSKVSYVAILLSWGVSITLDNAVHLPYMLERGEQRIGAAVKATLRTMFDCQINQFCFTQVCKTGEYLMQIFKFCIGIFLFPPSRQVLGITTQQQ